MTKQELMRWKSELEAELQVKLEAVSALYRRKLSAIDVLLEDGESRPAMPAQPPQGQVNAGQRPQMISKFAATCEAVALTPDRFTTAMLFDIIERKYPGLVKQSMDLSNSVWMLKKKEKIAVIKKGDGFRIPTEYRTTPKFRLASGSGA